jgi:hypothetical protein
MGKIDIEAVTGRCEGEYVKGPGRKRSLPFVEDKSFNAVNKVREKYDLEWNEFFRRLAMYESGLHYIFTAPKDFTKSVILDHNTVMGLIPLWVMNIARNLTDPNAPPDIMKLKEKLHTEGRACIAIAAGPSVQLRGHLQQLHAARKCGYKGLVFCAAHALRGALEAGVIPDVVVVVDGNDEKIPVFFQHEIVARYVKDMNLASCISVSPKTLDAWGKKNIYFFRTSIPGNMLPNVDTLISTMFGQYPELDSGGNNGAAMYSLACLLGCSECAMIGFDLGYPKGTPYEDTMYFNAYCGSIGEHYKDVPDMIERCYEDFHHPVFDTDYYFDFVYAVFRDCFFEMTQAYQKHFGTKAVNCTEGGTVYCEGLECIPLKDFIDRHS